MSPRSSSSILRTLADAWDGPAITVTGAALLLPGMVITDVLGEGSAAGPIWSLIGAGLVGWLAMTVVLLGLDRIAVRRLGPGWVRRVTVLAVYAVAGAIRVLAVVGIDSLVTGWDAAALTWLPLRVVSSMVWLSAVAVLVNRQRRSADELGNLRRVQTNLELTRVSLADELVTMRRGLEATQEQVAGALGDVRDRLATADNPEQLLDVADLLEVMVDDLVRPTSHALAEDGPPLAAVADESPTDPVPWIPQARGLVLSWADAAPFQPISVLVITVPITLAAMVSQPWQVANLIGLAALAVAALLLWAAQALVVPAMRAMPDGLRIVIVIAVYVAVLAVGVITGRLMISAGGLPFTEVILLPLTAAVSVGGASALDARRRYAEEEAVRLILATEWSVSRVRQQLWAERRRMAIALHGRVQASVTACEFLIRAWVDGGGTAGASDTDLVGIKARVGQALDDATEMETQSRPVDIDTSITELSRVWSGILVVRATVSPEARTTLAADPVALDAAREVLRELLLNSVRHSRSTIAEIHVGLQDERTVAIIVVTRVEESSRPIPVGSAHPERGPGIGLKLLDSIALQWESSVSETGRTTRVLLATAAH